MIQINLIILYLIGKTKRKSIDISNHYTVLFSEILSSWSKLPRRDKGLICSTNANWSSRFGKVFGVIPFDSTPIRKCSELVIFEILIKYH